jgi:hypothetical protein
MVVMSVTSLNHDMVITIVVQGRAYDYTANKTAQGGPDFIVSGVGCLRSQAKPAECGDH